jgi:hypothetical protein
MRERLLASRASLTLTVRLFNDHPDNQPFQKDDDRGPAPWAIDGRALDGWANKPECLIE